MQTAPQPTVTCSHAACAACHDTTAALPTCKMHTAPQPTVPVPAHGGKSSFFNARQHLTGHAQHTQQLTGPQCCTQQAAHHARGHPHMHTRSMLQAWAARQAPRAHCTSGSQLLVPLLGHTERLTSTSQTGQLWVRGAHARPALAARTLRDSLKVSSLRGGSAWEACRDVKDRRGDAVPSVADSEARLLLLASTMLGMPTPLACACRQAG